MVKIIDDYVSLLEVVVLMLLVVVVPMRPIVVICRPAPSRSAVGCVAFIWIKWCWYLVKVEMRLVEMAVRHRLAIDDGTQILIEALYFARCRLIMAGTCHVLSVVDILSLHCNSSSS